MRRPHLSGRSRSPTLRAGRCPRPFPPPRSPRRRPPTSKSSSAAADPIPAPPRRRRSHASWHERYRTRDRFVSSDSNLTEPCPGRCAVLSNLSTRRTDPHPVRNYLLPDGPRIRRLARGGQGRRATARSRSANREHLGRTDRRLAARPWSARTLRRRRCAAQGRAAPAPRSSRRTQLTGASAVAVHYGPAFEHDVERGPGRSLLDDGRARFVVLDLGQLRDAPRSRREHLENSETFCKCSATWPLVLIWRPCPSASVDQPLGSE